MLLTIAYTFLAICIAIAVTVYVVLKVMNVPRVETRIERDTFERLDAEERKLP